VEGAWRARKEDEDDIRNFVNAFTSSRVGGEKCFFPIIFFLLVVKEVEDEVED